MNNDFNELMYSREMPLLRHDQARLEFILENIEDTYLRILDIGCWDGSYAIRYKKETNSVYGIESSKTAARKAKENGIIVQHGYFPDARLFRNKKFDIIVAGEIIEHIFDTDKFLLAIKNKLKKNGKFILTTPNVASLPRRLLLLLGKNPYLENRVKKNYSVGHIRYFTFDDIYKLLADNGFVVCKSQSDIVNFNGNGTLYTTIIPKLKKQFGKTIMICAKLAS